MNPTLILSLVLLQIVAASSRCPQNPSIFSFTLGSSKATVISDGLLFFPELGFTVPRMAVQRSYQENFRNSEPYFFEQNILVVDLPAGRVMIDAGSFNVPGVPTFAGAGKLIQNLKAAGISPESIDAVLISHAHIDHVAGLGKKDSTGAFRNATIYINRRDHEFWTADELDLAGTSIPVDFGNLIKNVYLNRIAWYQERNKLRLLEDFESPLEGIRFVPSNGHSPGHSTIEVTSDGERLLAIGDAWVTKADQVQNPEWGFFIESDQEIAYRSRISLLEDAVSSRDLVLAYHEEFPGLGHISKSGPFFDWVPTSMQSLSNDVEAE